MNWQSLIKEYLTFLNIERGLSKNTIDSYSRDLKKLTFYLNENEIVISPININDTIIKEFIYELAKKISSRSQEIVISGLRRFFDFLVFEDY